MTALDNQEALVTTPTWLYSPATPWLHWHIWVHKWAGRCTALQYTLLISKIRGQGL